jgi:hypothetical protein
MNRRIAAFVALLVQIAACTTFPNPRTMNERFSLEHWPKPDLDRYLDLESRPPRFLRTDGAAVNSKGMVAGTSNPVAFMRASRCSRAEAMRQTRC